MKKNIFKSTLLSFMALLFMTSCETKDFAEEFVSRNTLALSVITSPVKSSRGLIETTYLPDGSAIGFLFCESDKSSYEGQIYNNIKAVGFGDVNQLWMIDNPIVLSDKKGTLYSYFPYSAKVTDFTAVPVETASQTDYMYADPVSNIDEVNKSANLVMKHALAAVRVNIKNSKGTSLLLTHASVQADNIAVSANLDVKNEPGKLSAFHSVGEFISRDLNMTITEDASIIDFIVIPNGASSPLTVDFTINDVECSLQTNDLNIKQGYIYTLDVIVNEGVLSWDNVRVDEWGYTEGGIPVIKVGEHTVTLNGDINGIAFNNKVNEDGTVTIVAVPMESGKKVVQVTASTGAVLQQTVDDMTGIRTVILSDITADTQVNFNGISS